jgi:alpha,alpha-trehalose phosphorylase
MLHRQPIHGPEYVYPLEPWRLVEKDFHPLFLAQTEAIFSVANGYLGMRGSFEEGRPVYHDGTFVNGFYETWPIVYGEEAFGFARTGQTIVNVTDGKRIRLYVDDEPFFLPTAELSHFERALDMRAGTLDREVLWETASGKQVSIRSRRLVSLRHRHLAAIAYEVTLLNADAPVLISSELTNGEERPAADIDPRRARRNGGPVLEPGESYRRGTRLVLGQITRNSRMSLACAVHHELETECAHSSEGTCSDHAGQVVFKVDAKPKVPIRLVKYLAYHTSRRAPVEELCQRAEWSLDRAAQIHFEGLLKSQREHLDDFWRRSDVEVEGDDRIQQALRFNLFQMCQATARAEGVGIPSKGLTGDGYEGHYFWDTEIYVLPFLIYTEPRIARNLLKFRHSHLEQARQRAREVNQKGALFPWRTINGDEASAYYAAGTAQYHINADIVYAIRKYVEATDDVAFLLDEGAEILVETARLWADLGFFSEVEQGSFCIQGVTGPDEYNTVVDNNAYTNLMARENLAYAAETVRLIHADHPQLFLRLEDRTGVTLEEVAAWQRAADRMYVPHDQRLGILLQDDSFQDKEPWDFENTPPDRYPLLLHFHPLVIYRHKVIKQADVVLATFLLSHQFTLEEKKRNFDYYDPLTTGDSSLSVSIQAIVAAEIGNQEKAAEYARYSMQMDLGNVHGNVRDGLHVASMGGNWMLAVYGLAGMRDWAGQLCFRPRTPALLERVRFPLSWRGARFQVDLGRGSVSYTLLEGDQIVLRHEDEEVRLTRDAPKATRAVSG